jgi:hypothetical protein
VRELDASEAERSSHEASAASLADKSLSLSLCVCVRVCVCVSACACFSRVLRLPHARGLAGSGPFRRLSLALVLIFVLLTLFLPDAHFTRASLFPSLLLFCHRLPLSLSQRCAAPFFLFLSFRGALPSSVGPLLCRSLARPYLFLSSSIYRPLPPPAQPQPQPPLFSVALAAPSRARVVVVRANLHLDSRARGAELLWPLPLCVAVRIRR